MRTVLFAILGFALTLAGSTSRIMIFCRLWLITACCFSLVFGIDYLTDRAISTALTSFLAWTDLEPGLGSSLIISIWLGLSLSVSAVVLRVLALHDRLLVNQLAFLGALAAGIVSLIPGISLLFLVACTGYIFLGYEPFS